MLHALLTCWDRKPAEAARCPAEFLDDIVEVSYSPPTISSTFEDSMCQLEGNPRPQEVLQVWRLVGLVGFISLRLAYRWSVGNEGVSWKDHYSAYLSIKPAARIQSFIPFHSPQTTSKSRA